MSTGKPKNKKHQPAAKALAHPTKIHGQRALIVKCSIPRLITDNPMAAFTTKDGQFNEQFAVNSNLIKLMNGAYEAYFELVLTSTKIISMTRVPEARFYGEEKTILKMVDNGK
jgi:hypothetical protein